MMPGQIQYERPKFAPATGIRSIQVLDFLITIKPVTRAVMVRLDTISVLLVKVGG